MEGLRKLRSAPKSTKTQMERSPMLPIKHIACPHVHLGDTRALRVIGLGSYGGFLFGVWGRSSTDSSEAASKAAAASRSRKWGVAQKWPE